MNILFEGNILLEVHPTDEAYRYRAIRMLTTLTLYFSLPEHVEVPVGAYVEYEGQTFTLNDEDNFKKNGTRDFEYTLILDAADANLKKYKAKDQSGRLKFSMTAKPHEHLQMIVNNLNQRESGWTIGLYVDATEKVIAYNHMYLIEALNAIADEFNTEWEINGKEISLRRVEYNKSAPLALSYGKGNGFKPGVGRTTEKKGVEVLYVQGGSRNIDASKYGSADLLLPKSQSYTYEGRVYITDSDGLYIKRGDKALTHGNEDSLDLTNIYPSRVGAISGVNVVDASKNFYDIIDSSIPGALDYEACLIDGEKMTIIFQTGMLTSREFEVKYIHAGRRFEIVPAEIDGQTMPGGVFLPAIGDKYAVFGIQLPAAYISDNSTQTGSSWDMFKEAVKYLYENEETKFTFTGEMDGIWAKQNWLAIGAKIKPGGYVDFSDPQFAPDGVLIRIMGVKDYINRPQSPVLELSNSIAGSTLSSELKKIDSNEVIAGEMYRSVMNYTKRRFRDSEETLKMLEAAMLEGYGDSISPITIRTMAMLVGDESLQFRFVDNMVVPTQIAHNISYNNTTKVLSCPAGIIQHMTMGITTMSPTHSVSDYKFWSLSAYTSPPMTEEKKKYYLYAKVSKANTSGTFVLSETAIPIESVTGYYHLLVGILNSEYEGERSFVTLYGFTEILPGRITVDEIASANRQTVFDLANGIIEGVIRFRSGSTTKDVKTEIESAQSSASSANSKIDNLKIANENLMNDSSFELERTLSTATTTGGEPIYAWERSSDYAFDGNTSIKVRVIRLTPTGATQLNLNYSYNGSTGKNYLTPQIISAIKGKAVVYSVRVKGVGSSIGKQVYIRITESTGVNYDSQMLALTSDWQVLGIAFTVGSTITSLSINMRSSNTLAIGDVFYLDCDFLGLGNKAPEGWLPSNADIIAKTARLITLSGATQIITVSKTGVNTPASAFTIVGSAQNTTITIWEYSIDGGSYSSTLPTGVARSGDVVTIDPATVTFKGLNIKASDGTYNDTFTVARAIDGKDGSGYNLKGTAATYSALPESGVSESDGYMTADTGKLYVYRGGTFPPEAEGVLIRGVAGQDGYTVILANENHTFPGSETAALPGSAVCNVIAYKGATAIAAVVTVGALPTGLTATVSGTEITFTASSALTTPGGIVDVTIVAEGKTFVLPFTYSISFKGAPGADVPYLEVWGWGYTATPFKFGVWVNETKVVSNTAVGFVVASMNKDFTDVSSAVFSTYANNALTTDMIAHIEGLVDKIVCIYTFDAIFENAALRQTFINLGGSKNRPALSERTPYVLIGLSKDESGNWQMQPGEASENWGANQTTVGTKAYQGGNGIVSNGVDGAAGISITGADVEFAVNTSATVAPTSGWTTVAPTLTAGQQLWTRTKTTYSSGSPTYSSPANITPKDGKGVSSITEEYYLSTSKVTPTGGSWVTSPPTWEPGKYLCTRVKIVYTDASIVYTSVVISTEWEAANNALDSALKVVFDKKVRYIRDWLNGSTANTGNHWIEIKAFTQTGENIALGKPVTASAPNQNASPLSIITDGITNNVNAYVYLLGPLQYVQVDLEEVYTNIDKISVWHYYGDSRTYNATKTEVSEDGVTWIPVYDSALSGKYIETSAGKSMTVNVSVSIAKAQADATNAAKTYSDAQDQLRKTEALAYADGKVTAEEAARIAADTAYLNAAKAYAEAEDAALQTTVQAYADGKVTASESATIAAAQAYAELKKIEAQAYADGKVTAEEAARIADVQAKYLAAKALADAAQEGVDDINNPDRLTADKKQRMQIEYTYVLNTYTALQSQANNLGISYATLQSAYTTYMNYVNSNNLLASLTTTSNYNGATYRTNLNNYYSQEEWLRNSITSAHKTNFQNAFNNASSALSLANSANNNAGSAQSTANTANSNASNALTYVDRLIAAMKAMGNSAWEEFVQDAMDGETVVFGGYLKNEAINTGWMQATIVTAAYIEALSVTAKRIRTANSNRRIELLDTDNTLSIYDETGNKAMEMAYNSAISDSYFYIEMDAYLGNNTFVGANRTQNHSAYNVGSYDSRTGTQGDFTAGFPRGYDWRISRQQVSTGRYRYFFRRMTHGIKVGNPDGETDSYYGQVLPSTTVYDRGVITGNLTIGGKLKTSVYDHRSIGAPAEGFCVVNIIDGNFTLPLPFDIVGSNPIYQQSKLDQVSIGTEITLCNRNTNSTASYISTNPSGNYILSKAGTYVSSIIISPGQTALFKLFYDNTYGARWMVVWQVS